MTSRVRSKMHSWEAKWIAQILKPVGSEKEQLGAWILSEPLPHDRGFNFILSQQEPRLRMAMIEIYCGMSVNILRHLHIVMKKTRTWLEILPIRWISFGSSLYLYSKIMSKKAKVWYSFMMIWIGEGFNSVFVLMSYSICKQNSTEIFNIWHTELRDGVSILKV